MQDTFEDEFEKRIKEKFDELCKDYDGMGAALAHAHAMSGGERPNWDYYLTDKYICDCEKNYGGDCKYPDKYRDGGCK